MEEEIGKIIDIEETLEKEKEKLPYSRVRELDKKRLYNLRIVIRKIEQNIDTMVRSLTRGWSPKEDITVARSGIVGGIDSAIRYCEHILKLGRFQRYENLVGIITRFIADLEYFRDRLLRPERRDFLATRLGALQEFNQIAIFYRERMGTLRAQLGVPV